MRWAAQAVYVALREAEYRSTAFVPYWNVPLLRAVVPRQRRCTEALKVINATLDGLIAKSQSLVRALHAGLRRLCHVGRARAHALGGMQAGSLVAPLLHGMGARACLQVANAEPCEG